MNLASFFSHMPKLDESIKANLFAGNDLAINKKKFKPVYEHGYCPVFEFLIFAYRVHKFLLLTILSR